MFSLGALLYELICGASPWTKEQERQIVAGLAQNPHPQPMQKFRRDVPPELERLIRRALAWDAAERPIAEDLAAELSALAPTLDNTPLGRVTEPHDPDDTSLLARGEVAGLAVVSGRWAVGR